MGKVKPSNRTLKNMYADNFKSFAFVGDNRELYNRKIFKENRLLIVVLTEVSPTG